MLDEICAEIKNYFAREGDIHIGDFTISNGTISPSIVFPTNYFRIVGSHLNDGIHKVSDDDLIDEGEFHGAVWIMSPSRDFLDLVDEIEAWQKKYSGVDGALTSPFQSESFGGYSYSKISGNGNNGSSSIPTWQSIYASRLKRFRRFRTI